MSPTQNNLNSWRLQPITLLLHGFFFMLFCSVSILNHYFFRTAALDDGIANQALYQFAHFHPAYCSILIEGRSVYFLGLHFSLWIPILSPLYWIFGSYTLLLVQNVALVFCGWGIIKICKQYQVSQKLSVLILFQFYASFALYSALASDFHESVLGACFFPWFYYYYAKEKKVQTFLCFLAILISKENFAIWLPFVCLGMILQFKQFTLAKIKFPLFLIFFCVIWFLLVGVWIMPALSPLGKFEQLSRFSHLGSTLSEIMLHIIQHPIQMFQLFYQSHIQPDVDENIKHEFLKVLLVSGGIALFIRPAFLIMVLPLLMQKLWNKEVVFWGINYHYNIELAPVIAVAIIMTVVYVEKAQLKALFVLIVLGSTLWITIKKMQTRKSFYYDSIKENVFEPKHYQSPLPIKEINDLLSLIPSNASVCAQANLAAHLATRDTIYHFPLIKNAQYVVLFEPPTNTYPMDEKGYTHCIDSLSMSPYWVSLKRESKLIIFKRK